MNADFMIRKYPRTPHLEGSRLQPGDEDLSQIPFSGIQGKYLVVEEKIDGANSGVSFDAEGNMMLQSRGHYLTGGYRERHYNLMKQWAMVHKDTFYSVLGSRYIMYGEWMYAKHTIYYDALPHYFMEFDIYDREKGIYLDTPSRRRLTSQMSVSSVPVLGEKVFSSKDELLGLLGQSNYVTGKQRQSLYDSVVNLGLDPQQSCGETELSGLMEGLYIKIEENGQVAGRLKYVRPAFLQCVDFSETHWIDRPIIPNQLAVPMEKLFEN
ncbi:MAG: RNA ligase family protein [Eubacteriales bacterium]|nr:RNA ligase family protein [Eubacteriales bacterium]